MTEYAITQCENEYIVGYTDLHPGYDCAMAWRGIENLCMDLYDNSLIYSILTARELLKMLRRYLKFRKFMRFN
jgi:hypothetical protein